MQPGSGASSIRGGATRRSPLAGSAKCYVYLLHLPCGTNKVANPHAAHALRINIEETKCDSDTWREYLYDTLEIFFVERGKNRKNKLNDPFYKRL